LCGISPQAVNLGGSGTPVTAVPDAGYYFANWSDGGTVNPRTEVDVANHVTVTATFAPIIPPVIGSAPDVSGGELHFQFTGTVGQHYRVEHTPMLPAPGSWQVVTDIVSLATSPCTISVPATNDAGFYRVGWVQ